MVLVLAVAGKLGCLRSWGGQGRGLCPRSLNVRTRARTGKISAYSGVCNSPGMMLPRNWRRRTARYSPGRRRFCGGPNRQWQAGFADRDVALRLIGLVLCNDASRGSWPR